MKDSDTGNIVIESEMPHRCGLSCLGPLTFHCQAVGDQVSLSQGCRLAERTEGTFKNGLVFSSRPLRVREKICLRVEKDSINWHGALRVGFTSVPPSARPLPLSPMAIPDLTDQPRHWAAAVPESYCQAGSELEFWVTCGGNVYITSNNSRQHKLLDGVDLSQPLWAMIDIYGQTCSIFLQGSKKKGFLCTRYSCPAPERLPSPDVDYSLIPDECMSSFNLEIPADEDSVMDCVVCLGEKATISLPCGHRCLCRHCTIRVVQQFGVCPLCRHEIRAPSMERRCFSGVLL